MSFSKPLLYFSELSCLLEYITTLVASQYRMLRSSLPIRTVCSSLLFMFMLYFLIPEIKFKLGELMICRFQDWSPEKSCSSDPMLSGKSRSDTYTSSTTQRGYEWGLGPYDNFYRHQPAKRTSTEVPESKTKVLDPQGPVLQRWNKIFVLACIFAVSVDPLFFYIPVVNEDNDTKCLGLDKKLAIITSALRSFIDMFYVLHMAFQYRTGFIAPSSRVFGRGVLVEDLHAIARRYLTSYFIIDLLAVLPLPQVAIGVIIRTDVQPSTAKEVLKFIVICQYVPRWVRIFPLFNQVVSSAGLLTENAWAGAVLNLVLYMLASHIFGAWWYLLSLERQDKCWRLACRNETIPVERLDCSSHQGNVGTEILDRYCPINGDPKNPQFNFGIYLPALENVAALNAFLEKFFYCFWWGLQNLSSLGQNLDTSTYVWENIFAVLIAISGLVLFALLIGNMQTYLQSTTIRIEEMRVKRRDAEQWMAHRLLPGDLRERIRRHEQYKWQETRGVNEELILSNLPKDLRRDIKRHLCLALLKRVPMFEKMDEQLIDAMLDRLKPVLYTEKSCIIREGDPVNEMLFIMRGNLNSRTTDGGRSGFFNEETLNAGDFCGEELLTWALDPRSVTNLPISTRTVVALKEVEAFALCPDDLKFVASQFRKLHSKKLRHTFRLYSHQWRMWAACFIQAAWRRYSRKKLEESLHEEENKLQVVLAREGGSSPSLGATIFASRFAANALRAVRRSGARKARLQERMPVMLLQKPPEPDFTAEEQ